MVCELLAEYLGTFILIVSTVFLMRYEAFLDYAEEFADNRCMRFNVAFVELAAGLGIVLLHNTWTLDYRGVVTGIGALMIGESIFHLLATDEQEEHLIQKVNDERYWRFYGLASMFLGLYLITKGFRGF
jgi:hypothetical protein